MKKITCLVALDRLASTYYQRTPVLGDSSRASHLTFLIRLAQTNGKRNEEEING